MGKAEREYVELLERNTDKYLNSIGLDVLSEHDERRVTNLGEFIKLNYQFRKSCHIGNTYGTSIGDIKLIDDSDKYLELKFLKSGSGTRANISQDALTKNLLFSSDVKSWNKYRVENNFQIEVLSILKIYRNYKKDISQLKNNNSTISKLGAILKKEAETDQDAKKLKEEIEALARIDKLRYIKYLSQQNYIKDNVKKFTILLLMGRHTEESLNEFKDLNLKQTLELIPDNYEIVYIYKNKIKKDTYKIEKIFNFINRVEDYDVRISCPIEQSNLTIDFKKGDHWYKTLRFAFHWKNKFQGIETPCLNVFDENLEQLFT